MLKHGKWLYLLIYLDVNCLLASGVFLNKWAVQVEGGKPVANHLAEQHGFRNLGQVGPFGDIYAFEHHEVHKRSLGPSRHHHSRLLRDPKVQWAEQQVAKKRVKRDSIQSKSAVPWTGLLNDDLWPKMWYLHGGATGGYDMNVIGAWERGYTGKGVVVTILDDGIEHSHPDLKANYDPAASKDINGNDDDPMPRYDNRDENRHGTRCAGEVAAVANNSKCVVGIAFNANIGGVRMLDGDVSDLVEASALGHNPQHVDIYSASWGPDDNGKVVDGPAKLAKDTFVSGVLNGRQGKGSIYIWASGNGGSLMDSCSCDGYTNSIFTLSVSSVSEHNNKPWYLEECASTLATTYSSGENYHEKKILSTDLHGRCTEQHTGTSASAPLAAAIAALALEANPDLTWRDMQALVMRTSNPQPFVDGEWETNGVGRKVSHRYGYGLMDAEALVKEAERWTVMPEQNICSSKYIVLDQPIDGDGLELKVETDGCEQTDSSVQYLEHVQAKVSLRYSRRGDLEMYLLSPSGTRSRLLPHRKNDHLEGTFSDWPFMSVFYWGENPVGTWRLQIVNQGTQFNHGIIEKWQLILYGTATDPVKLKPEPKYPPNKFPNGYKDNHIDQDGEPTGHSGEVYDKNHVDGTEDSLPKAEFSCDPECAADAKCTGPSVQDCLACKHARLMPGGTCVSECPDNSYFDLDTATCFMCEPPCDQCQGPDILKDCLSCTQGYYLVQGQGHCLAQCREGYFQAPDDNVCHPCAVGCLTCHGDADTCSKCVKGYDLELNQCVLHCAEREFKNNQERCEPCHDSCLSCFGAAAHHCSRCVDDLLYQNGSCIPDCLQGYYMLETTEGIYCQKCHASCLECEGPDIEQCTACYQPFKFAQGTCLEGCPLGQYENEYSICGLCDMTCNTCRGPSPTDCLTCDFGHWLQDGQCVPFCKHGHFPFEAYSDMGERVSECMPCHPSCGSCTGGLSHHCVTCHQDLLLTHTGHCLTECPIGSHPSADLTCLPCAASCYSCVGPAPTHCSSCPEPLYLTGTGECQPHCPPGYYGDMGICYTCHPSCSVCTGGGVAECTECASGLVQLNGLCSDETHTYNLHCDTHQYYDKHIQSCAGCHPTCSECRGAGPAACLSCPHLLTLSPGGACLPCCGEGQGGTDCCLCDHTGVCEAVYQSSTPVSSSFPPESSSLSPSSISSISSSSSSGESAADTDLFLPSTTRGSHQSSNTDNLTNPRFSSRPSQVSTTKSTKSRGDHTTSSSSSSSPSIHRTVTTTESQFGSLPDDRTTLSSSASAAFRKHWATIVTFLVFACVFSVGVFFLIFGLLQARSSEQLCWSSHRYQPVPTLYRNGTGKVRITEGEYTDEEVEQNEEEALYQKV